MPKEVSSTLLARDAYPLWRRRVTAAKSSVVVYSPFLDRLVLHLVGHCPLPRDKVTVVTDLSPRSGALDYMAQLKTLRSLLDLDVNVRSLPRLHAKVLRVDDGFVTLGSQNFTSYARRSNECTAVAVDPVTQSAFVSTLDKWLADSTPVAIELLDQLVAQLEERAAAFLMASTALEQDFNDLVERYGEQERVRLAARRAENARREAERVEAERRRSDAWFETLTRRSSIRLAQQIAWASVKMRGSHESGWYATLLADPGCNLNAWVGTADDPDATRRLERLAMYPVMLRETGRMGFARVGKGRISYVRDGVVWSRTLSFNDQQAKVITRFPETGLNRRSITLEIQPQGWPIEPTSTISVLFDGDSFNILEPTRTAVVGNFEGAVREYLSNRDTLPDFIQQYFESFTLSGLDLRNHNAHSFFTGAYYKVELFEFASKPFFLASRIA